MQGTLRAAVFALLLILIAAGAPAQSIRDRIRLSPEKRTPITEEQANELTLTLNAAAVRPIQIWVRTAGTHRRRRSHDHRDAAGARGDATSRSASAPRVFRRSRRSSMFQAIVSRVTAGPAGTSVGRHAFRAGLQGSVRYVLEIVTEPLEALSVPNEAIIESRRQARRLRRGSERALPPRRNRAGPAG